MSGLRDLCWFFQRGKRGWAESDVWEMDHYLAGVIAGMAKELREKGMGYPCFHYKGRPCSCKARWESALFRIEYAFRYFLYVDGHGREEGYERWLEMEKNSHEAIRKALILMAKYWGNLWD